jgi:hypothetical protein
VLAGLLYSLPFVIPITLGICILTKAGVFHKLVLTIKLGVGISLLALPFFILGTVLISYKLSTSCKSEELREDPIKTRGSDDDNIMAPWVHSKADAEQQKSRDDYLTFIQEME